MVWMENGKTVHTMLVIDCRKKLIFAVAKGSISV